MQALGMVEVVGLAAGVEAADVACKTANVELVGYELAKGGGYVTIKVLGQVGAVTAAIDAAAEAAGRITRVVSKLVLPRPNDQVEPMVYSSATVGYEAPKPAPKAESQPAPAEPKSEAAPAAVAAPAPEKPAGTRAPARETAKAPAKATATAAKTTTGRK